MAAIAIALVMIIIMITIFRRTGTQSSAQMIMMTGKVGVGVASWVMINILGCDKFEI